MQIDFIVRLHTFTIVKHYIAQEVLPELRKDRKKKLPTSPPPLPPIDSNESQALLESNATPKIKVSNSMILSL